MTLSGCAMNNQSDWYQGIFTDREGVRAPHKATANKISYSHTVEFNARDSRLSVDERERLDAFLAKVSVKPRDNFILLGGGDNGRLAERRRATVRAFMELREVKTNTPATPLTSTDITDTVRVLISRYVVTLPRCPDMSDDPTSSRSNQPYSNFGCATAANLGLMIARPEDLAKGRNMGAADGEYMVRSIQAYRAGETKALLGESGTTENVTTDDLMKAMTGGDK